LCKSFGVHILVLVILALPHFAENPQVCVLRTVLEAIAVFEDVEDLGIALLDTDHSPVILLMCLVELVERDQQINQLILTR
jgi:hypothetical protein